MAGAGEEKEGGGDGVMPRTTMEDAGVGAE